MKNAIMFDSAIFCNIVVIICIILAEEMAVLKDFGRKSACLEKYIQKSCKNINVLSRFWLAEPARV